MVVTVFFVNDCPGFGICDARCQMSKAASRVKGRVKEERHQQRPSAFALVRSSESYPANPLLCEPVIIIPLGNDV